MNSRNTLAHLCHGGLGDRNNNVSGSRYFLRSNHASGPSMQDSYCIGQESSKRNEQWDCSRTVTRISSLKLGSSRNMKTMPLVERDAGKNKDCRESIAPSPKLQSAMKKSTPQVKKSTPQGPTKSNKHVMFGKTSALVKDTRASINQDTKWYMASDDKQFSKDATIDARKINRAMNYVASTGESTYNSSTGLTTPEALKDYLSSPEEIIGIEHMLIGQKFPRENLKSHQIGVLLEEQKQGKRDWQVLAEKLRSVSEISAYMAHKRAQYISLLD